MSKAPLTYEEYSALLALMDAKIESHAAAKFASVNCGPDVQPRRRAAEAALERAASAAFARLVLGQEP